MRKKRGFTIIEVAVSMGIMVIIAAVTLVLIPRVRRGITERDSTAKLMVATLRDAQSRAVNQLNDSDWGVRFTNNSTSTFFALFRGSSYATSTAVSTHPLPSTLSYVSATLPIGASRDVVFLRITGSANASTSVGIIPKQLATGSVTIFVASSGAARYE